MDAFRQYIQLRKNTEEGLGLDSPAFIKEYTKNGTRFIRLTKPLIAKVMRRIVLKAGVMS